MRKKFELQILVPHPKSISAGMDFVIFMTSDSVPYVERIAKREALGGGAKMWLFRVYGI